jgi:hypothetical protein
LGDSFLAVGSFLGDVSLLLWFGFSLGMGAGAAAVGDVLLLIIERGFDKKNTPCEKQIIHFALLIKGILFTH